jgi:hypothetical protein
LEEEGEKRGKTRHGRERVGVTTEHRANLFFGGGQKALGTEPTATSVSEENTTASQGVETDRQHDHVCMHMHRSGSPTYLPTEYHDQARLCPRDDHYYRDTPLPTTTASHQICSYPIGLLISHLRPPPNVFFRPSSSLSLSFFFSSSCVFLL